MKCAHERKQFGSELSAFPGIQYRLAQMATEIDAARTMMYSTARMKYAGVNFTKEGPVLKLFCSQVGEGVTSLAIAIWGGYGLTKGYPVEK